MRPPVPVVSSNVMSRVPIAFNGSPALSTISTLHWLLEPFAGITGEKLNVSVCARPRLSKYSIGSSNVSGVLVEDVASAGRFTPIPISVVGEATNWDVAILTGSRFVPLFLLTLPIFP